ncbi:MAG: MBL fold metallo-hydrolase [Clostridia bacterium]|nr:MBL fold metallo-hydrolase [Clostridia bacterium]
MDIIKVHGEYLDENTFIVPIGKECIVIDAGISYARLQKILEFLDLKCAAVLLTHGHFDHICGVAELQRAGAKVYLHKAADNMVNTSGNLAKLMGMVCERFRGDYLFEEDCPVKVCGLDIEIINTPGHSIGGVCYRICDMLFTGDTLFKDSYGATHFPTGNFQTLKDSIVYKLFSIKEDLKIFTGHDIDTWKGDKKISNPYNEYLVYAAPCTTLNYERQNNPILYGIE